MTGEIFGERELDAMLEEFGVPLEIGTDCLFGIRDIRDETMISGEAGDLVGKERSYQVKTGASATLAAGVTLKDLEEGVSYRVTEILQLEPDGALTRAFCTPG